MSASGCRQSCRIEPDVGRDWTNPPPPVSKSLQSAGDCLLLGLQCFLFSCAQESHFSILAEGVLKAAVGSHTHTSAHTCASETERGRWRHASL